jgi:hypothetical protein
VSVECLVKPVDGDYLLRNGDGSEFLPLATTDGCSVDFTLVF